MLLDRPLERRRRCVEVAARRLEQPPGAGADRERPRSRRGTARVLESLHRPRGALQVADRDSRLGVIPFEARPQRMPRAEPPVELECRCELVVGLLHLAGRERDEAEDLPMERGNDEVATLFRELETA